MVAYQSFRIVPFDASRYRRGMYEVTPIKADTPNCAHAMTCSISSESRPTPRASARAHTLKVRADLVGALISRRSQQQERQQMGASAH